MFVTFPLLGMFIPYGSVEVETSAPLILRLGDLPLPHFLWALLPIEVLANLLADLCGTLRVGREVRVTV